MLRVIGNDSYLYLALLEMVRIPTYAYSLQTENGFSILNIRKISRESAIHIFRKIALVDEFFDALANKPDDLANRAEIHAESREDSREAILNDSQESFKESESAGSVSTEKEGYFKWFQQHKQ